MDEKFGADCNHEGQSFICEPCAAAELARLRAGFAEIQNQRVLEITPALIMDYAKAQAEVVRLKAELVDTRELLKIARCPDCDGSGSYGVMARDGGSDQVQCRWCCDKAALEVKDG